MAQEQTLILIRARSFLDLLDLSLVVAKKKPLALALAAFAGVAPFEILNWWLTHETSWFGPWLMLVVLEAPLATAPLTILLGGLMFGRKTSPGSILALLGSSLFTLLLLQGLMRAFFLGTVVLSFLLPVRWMFLNEVILLERSPWFKVMGRSARLSRDRGTELLGTVIGECFFAALFALSAW